MISQASKRAFNGVLQFAAVAGASALLAVPAIAGSTPGSISSPTPKSSTEAPSTSPAADPAAPAGSESVSPTAKPASTTQQTDAGTIVDVAAANPSFKTLVTAVKAAGLAEVLAGEGPYTVFAPTDAAFAALPKGTLEKLLKPENKEALRKVLTYHVVPGKVESSSIQSGQVDTVEGSPVTVTVQNSRVTVNNAKVTTPDIPASNGVIHVIDKVILPPDLSASL